MARRFAGHSTHPLPLQPVCHDVVSIAALASKLPASGDRSPLTAPATLAALLAFVPSLLLAYSVSPSATFLNQACALVAWPVFAWCVAASADARSPVARPWDRGAWSALTACAVLLFTVVLSVAMHRLPDSLAWSAAGLLVAAAWTLAAGCRATQVGALQRAMVGFCVALAVVGVLSSAVALVQVFAPGWADGVWVAATSIAGRAAGNLRQPNHLSSVMLWSLVAVVWLGQTGRLRLPWVWPLAMLLVLAVVLSVSRTGAVGVVILALWGLLDRRLKRSVRALLLALPLAYGFGLQALSVWAQAGDGAQAFEGAVRFSTQGDVSSSRFAIWSNTLALVREHPWLGVGFGEFNRVWTLTPFPGRPTAFFDHTHNLPLQFAVEIGVPLALAVVALLVFALWRAHRAAAAAADPDDASALRAAFMVVLLVGLHSLLEYPLWYAYFLLPTAYALGLCLGPSPVGRGDGDAAGAPARSTAPGAAPSEAPSEANSAAKRAAPRWLSVGATLLALAGAYSVVDYGKVVVIFSPGPDAAPLEERIAKGKRSLFFAHHAHYAAATTSPRPAQDLPSFEVASHFLLDMRLMVAWARAQADAGDLERARYIADRIREFRREGSEEFLAACDDHPPGAPGAPAAPDVPFQCTPASSALSARDFR